MEMKETVLGLIPLDWDIIKAKDFCDFVTDGTHDTPLPKEEGHYLVTSKNLKNDGLDFENCYFISREDFVNINRRSGVSQFDLLYGMIGTIGNPTIIYQSEIDFAVKNVGLFKMGGDLQKSIWLYNFLNSHFYSNYISRMQSGTSQQFVGLGFLRKIPVLVPKTADNNIDWNRLSKINYSLTTVDKTIQATKNSIAKLEKLKTSLMQNLLTGKMKPDGSWRAEDDFWIDDKFGKVPKGWKISYLKDVQDINRESLPASTDPNYMLKYITIEAVFTDRIDFNKVPEYKFSEAPGRARRVIKKGDFIVSTVRPNLKGFARLQEEGDNWICSTGFATVSPIDKQVSNFYFFQILSFIGEKQFASFISGSNYPAVTDRDFKQLKVYEAPFEEQIEIAAKIESVVTIINKKQASINQLDKLKKSLMQNLLTGKVRIPQEALKQ